MNPYDFVRVDWSATPVRRSAMMHDKFQGLSGIIQGSISTESPLFIPTTRLNSSPTELKKFIRNGEGQVIIPGSSLKGLIRSLVETIGPGCWWLYDGTYRDRVDYTNKLPLAFRQCRDHKQLCPACRMFGLINGRTHLLGLVNFGDAVCLNPVPHDSIFTPVLDAPKPRHRAWYLSPNGDTVIGRKFFFHQPTISTNRELRKTRSGQVINQHIQPVGVGSEFRFVVSFSNLSADDYSLLLYALTLEPKMRHKIGYAKPAGLGSVKLTLNHVTVIDYSTRYTTPNKGQSIYKDEHLTEFLLTQTAFYLNNTALTLQDLRQIWTWPPPDNVAYGYPTRNWFDENPQATIAQTKDAPRQ